MIDSSLITRIINECTLDLLQSERVDSNVDEVLKRLLDVTDVDRVYVFRERRDEDGVSRVTQVHEVCADGIESQMGNPDLHDMPWLEYTPRWYDEFLERRAVYGHIPDFPESERMILEPQDIQSIMALPILFRGQFLGFIGFDSVRKRRDWLENEILLLRGMASVLGALWQREEREQAVGEAFDKLSRYHQISPFAVLEWGVDFKATYANATAERIFGYGAGEMLGLDGRALIPPHVMDATMAVWEAMLAERHGSAHINENLRKDGSLITCRWHYSVLRDANGQVESMLTIAEDVTEELSLQSDFQSLFHQGLDGVVYQDADGRIINANPAACRILGLTLDQMLGRTSIDPSWRSVRTDGTDFPGNEHPAMLALKTGKEIRDVVMGVVKPGEPQRAWILINAIPMMRSGEPTPFRVFTMFRDITEQHRMTRELREREEIFRLFAENVNNAIWIRKMGTGEAIFQNKAVEGIFGVSAEDYATDPNGFLEFIPEEDRPAIRATHQRYLKGEPFERDHRIIRKDGEVRWVSAKGFVIPSETGEPLLAGVMSDITERKRVLQEVENARTKAEELSQLKSNLMQNISHELRTPLTGAMGFLNLLKDRVQSDSKSLDYLTYMERSINRLASTLETIVEYSAVDSRRLESFPQAISLKETLDGILLRQKMLAEGKDLYMQVIWNGEDQVVVDPMILKTIVRHLLDNSIKFTEVGGVRITIDVTDDNLTVKVRDTGVGIPQEQMKYIFDEFRQGSEGLSRSFEGNGLGLAIVRKYIRFLKGTIDVKSVIDEETIFTVQIPVATSRPRTEIHMTTVKRVLYVEDDPIIRMMMKNSLTSYQLDVAANAEKAIELLRSNPYDAVLLDVNLGGGMNGFELCRHMRAEMGLTDLPIAAVTGLGMDSEQSLYQNGFTHYLPKPFERAHVVRLLETMAAVKVER